MSIWIISPGCFFIAEDRDLGIEGGPAAQSLGLCDAGHRRARKPSLAGDLPEGLASRAQGFNLERLFGRDPRPRSVRPAGPALETGQAFVLEAHQPFRNSDGRNADGAGYRAWRFAGRPPVDNHLRCCFGILNECSRAGLLSLWCFANATKRQILPLEQPLETRHPRDKSD